MKTSRDVDNPVSDKEFKSNYQNKTKKQYAKYSTREVLAALSKIESVSLK